ncbi:MAG TPA: MFS transporter, partial [Acidimicrobiales bacterium]|nr:MFS transporter [Acidimicrobiales bacterium]
MATEGEWTGADLARGEPQGEGAARAGYLRLLLVLLSSAAFFDGYDNQVVALLLPNVQRTFQVGVTTLALVQIPVHAGQFVAFFAVYLADRLGRRPLLLWTITGYTLFTVLTAASPSIWAFAAFQFGAQVFTGAEFGVAVTLVVEEFPTEGRGRALGTLLAMGPVGAVLVGLLAAVGLQDSPLSWRAFYLVGVVPLLVVAVGRRRMRESPRFSAEVAKRRAAGGGPGGGPKLRTYVADLLGAWAPRYRGRLAAVGIISLCQSLPTAGGTVWWAFYARRELGYPSSLVAVYFLVAAAIGFLGYLACGRAMEHLGRRPTATVYMVATLCFGVTLFQVSGRLVSLVCLAGAVFFGLGIGPVLSAFATELFPTAIRAQAGSWTRNVFASTGMLLGPFLVGFLGAPGGLVGTIGDAASILGVAILPAL